MKKKRTPKPSTTVDLTAIYLGALPELDDPSIQELTNEEKANLLKAYFAEQEFVRRVQSEGEQS